MSSLRGALAGRGDGWFGAQAFVEADTPWPPQSRCIVDRPVFAAAGSCTTGAGLSLLRRALKLAP